MVDSSPDSCFKGGKLSAPGFRFHPTDEELVVYYLKRKIYRRRLRINVIGVVDVYKNDPSELPGLSVLKSGDRQWFFFTPRSRKYPNAARSSRGTATGYWKATGKDRIIEYNSRSVGLKKTLVFYRGRAPNGERTDWVMHEYTMDEEELGRCKNAKDYYALYKLFKKSGAGPKNGEQYGAPFHEEEWVHDDDDDDDDCEDRENIAAPEEPRCVDADSLFCSPVGLQIDDLEKLLNEIPDAPGVTSTPFIEFAGVSQGHSEEEIQSTLLNNSYGVPFPPHKIGEFFPNVPFETTEVNSVFKTSDMAPVVFEKEDYIEMDDLLNPELDASSTKNSTQFLNPGDFNEFDQLFHDVSMSLHMEPVLQGTSADLSSLSNFANNMSEQRQQYFYQQFQDQTPENQLTNFMDPCASLNHFTDDNMWVQNNQADLFDQPQSSSGAFASPLSGVMTESTNHSMSVNTQDQDGQNSGGTKSQFSSALWAFMESIPSTPASACEGPLNQTFVRMSSFSRIRFNGKANGTSNKVTIAKKRSGNRCFLMLSIIGALCAIFWVFIAAVFS